MQRLIPLIIIFTMCLSSCNVKKIAEIILASPSNSDTKPVEQREQIPIEEARRRSSLHKAIKTDDVDRVRGYLEEGYDPNKSFGEQGYKDSTPLNVSATHFYNTYVRIKRDKEISDPPPDVVIVQLLVKAGADVNERPYIWARVFLWNNHFLDSMAETRNLGRKGQPPSTDEEWEEYHNEKIIEPIYFVNDANRIIEALLKAGSDPDMRGHPYPYWAEGVLKVTPETAKEYFAKGTRPINEAIKKGMRWESQVDLLLQYTTLDEDSIKAAKESKDPAMIEKVNRLWKEQNANRMRS